MFNLIYILYPYYVQVQGWQFPSLIFLRSSKKGSVYEYRQLSKGPLYLSGGHLAYYTVQVVQS